MDLEKISIKTEDQAWTYLEAALKGEYDAQNIRVSFDGWPNIDVSVSGEQFQSSLTPHLMQGFIDYQKSLNRTFAGLLYGATNASHLSDSDRQDFELVISVSQGSTILSASLQKSIGKCVEKLGDKMDGKHVVALACVAALYFGSTTMYKDYVKVQADTHDADIKVALSKQDTERLQVITQAQKQVTDILKIQVNAFEAHAALLKSGSQAESVTIQGVTLSGGQVKAITAKKPAPITDIQMTEPFRILMADTSNHDSVKVKIQSGKRALIAEFKDETMDDREIKLLKDKLISRERLLLSVHAVQRRGEITKAFIERIQEI